MEREQKLMRGWPSFAMQSAVLTSYSEISDHGNHLYTDTRMGRLYVT